MQYQLRNIAEALDGNASLPVEQHPRYLAAQAELQQARLDLSRTQVRASIAGTVSNVPKPGQYLAVGSPALALVGDQLWIEANFTETQLTYVRPREHVKVRVDTYPETESSAWPLPEHPGQPRRARRLRHAVQAARTGGGRLRGMEP